MAKWESKALTKWERAGLRVQAKAAARGVGYVNSVTVARALEAQGEDTLDGISPGAFARVWSKLRRHHDAATARSMFRA